MASDLRKGLNRRHFLISGAAASGFLASPAVLAQTAPMEDSTEIETAVRETSRRNLSSLRSLH